MRSKLSAMLVVIACSVLGLAVFTVSTTETLGKPPNKGGGSEYSVVTLDSVPGAAYDIRRHPEFVEIVGATGDPSAARYWVLNTTGQVIISKKLPQRNELAHAARGINGSGVIVGGCQTVQDEGLQERPLAWADFLSDPVELPVPPGFAGFAGAEHVNDNLLVVGYLAWENGDRSHVAWQLAFESGILTVRDAIVIATGSDFGRGGLNNDGYYAASLDLYAWVWQVVWDTDLGGLDVVYSQRLFPGTAQGINEAGTICGGYLNPTSNQLEGYALEFDGTFHRLTLPVNNRERASALATAINDASPVQVAGEGDVWRNGTWWVSSPSVIWDLDGGMTTLPLKSYSSLTYKPIFAMDDAGWAVGSAEVQNQGEYLPMLLIPR